MAATRGCRRLSSLLVFRADNLVKQHLEHSEIPILSRRQTETVYLNRRMTPGQRISRSDSGRH